MKHSNLEKIAERLIDLEDLDTFPVIYVRPNKSLTQDEQDSIYPITLRSALNLYCPHEVAMLVYPNLMDKQLDILIDKFEEYEY